MGGWAEIQKIQNAENGSDSSSDGSFLFYVQQQSQAWLQKALRTADRSFTATTCILLLAKGVHLSIQMPGALF